MARLADGAGGVLRVARQGAEAVAAN